MNPTVDIGAIMRLLPHRYPFLLVDRILELVPGQRITGLKNVTINEPFFQGHFPSAPIMPGVLIVEAMGQVGGVLVFESVPEQQQGKPIFFTGLDKVRFRKPVVPGDQVIFEVSLVRQRAKAVKMAGTAKVADKLVAQAEMMASFGDNA